MSQRDSEILDQLRAIIDPALGKDIVTLGYTKNLKHDAEGKVSFTVELTTPACPIKERFNSQCEQAVRQLPWVKDVAVTMSAASRGSALAL